MYKDHNQFNVPVPASRSGYTGRECPECRKFFKLVFGTGIKHSRQCYCPYCGHHQDHSYFHTKDQIDYVTSVAVNAVTREFNDSLQQMARDFNRSNRRSKGLLQLSMEVTSTPTNIRVPADPKLETYIECTNCTLKYAVYGVYAFCPDCARHNSVQILENNLAISSKLLDLSVATDDNALAKQLIGSALTDVVSSFDGFGREICRTYASKSSNSSEAEKIRFQNLPGAQNNILKCFGFDIATKLTSSDWEFAIRCFQKRHVLEHRSGVVDEDYTAKANDPKAVVGRKVSLSKSEVRRLIEVIRELGNHIYTKMEEES